MYKYNDLEMIILSCFLQRPELMEETILDDKYFIKNKNVWLFMKSVYKKFGTFDLSLMYSVVSDKYKLVTYIEWLLDVEAAPSRFKKYEKQLIDLYNEFKKEKWIIEKVFKEANELYLRNINTKDFKNKIDKIYSNAEEIFKEN